MKREGRQHGMVRTHRILPSRLNPRPATRFVNEFDLPPTAGLFTKVSSKPTNHSKFTGKCCKARCNGCHMHPVCKAKDKTKGTQKLRSCDVVSNHRLVTWRVVEGRQGLNFSGYSASGILDQLEDDDDGDRDVDEHDGSCAGGDFDHVVMGFQPIKAEIVIHNSDHDDDENGNHGGDDVDDDAISYCNVGFVMDEAEGDEDWCLVGEM
ncbi:uncharacterized protein LOC107415210 [Ziziphus jujuba]|uniref:Uncharacterized protein LOC107415210 n=1 Tax=Ziziphus jujuba TaxID=326968 RepID=A0ABM4A701_ZIZJJ|nr:uncharacterized protein LOC107415210 [Ziziphus jujuba]